MGCIKLHILDEQYKRTELKESNFNKGLTFDFCCKNVRRYYVSGLPWYEGLNPSTNPYKFNGCEFVEMHGYDVTDLGKRGVHHAKNRFDTMDRFCEKFPWQSPYVHANNNPVRYIDLQGDNAWDFLGGILHSVGSNLSLGIIPTNTSFVSNTSHYNAGRDIGDAISVVMGAVETIVGAGAAVGGVVATPATAGASLAATAEGTAVAVHGAGVVGTAVKSMATQEGRMSQASSSSGRAGKTIANENGVKVKSHGTGDAHKPAHAHVEGGGKQVRVGPNGKPLKGEPELSSKQSKVVNDNIKDIRKEVNKVGKENKRIEDELRRGN